LNQSLNGREVSPLYSYSRQRVPVPCG